MRLFRLIALAAFVAPGPTFSQSSSLGPDAAGGKDHTLISRFVGSQIVGYQELGFGEGTFFVPRVEAGYDPKKELDQNKVVKLEGKVTRLVYIAPRGKSALEVQRNYEQALRAAGLNVITSVNGTGAWWGSDLHWGRNFGKLSYARPLASDVSPFERDGGHYLYGTLKRGGTDAAVSVYTNDTFGITRDFYKVAEKDALVAVAIQIVEHKALQTGQVTVAPDAIRKGLETEGKMVLYGIYFDTGRAEIKPQSRPQLEQMAAVLKQQVTLKVFIVGHTDNEGAVDGNLALSQQRAQAVALVLSRDYGIDAKRLGARGVAGFAPVASNATDDGRAKNRRVEMVTQ